MIEKIRVGNRIPAAGGEIAGVTTTATAPERAKGNENVAVVLRTKRSELAEQGSREAAAVGFFTRFLLAPTMLLRLCPDRLAATHSAIIRTARKLCAR